MKRIVELIWAAVMIAVVASTATLLIANRGGGQRWVTEAEYERVERYKRLDEVRQTLLDEYYQPLDEDALLTGAIRGMTSAVGDVYTFYYTPEEMKREHEDSEGRYEGIGIQVERTQDGCMEIVRVYPDTPSAAAGLRAGDRIVAVDGEPVAAETFMDYLEGVGRMRGEENTEVRLGIERGEQTLEFSVLRSAISISYASYSIIDGDIGYVSIAQFTGDAADRFDEAIEHFREKNVSGLIIDVRNDPGGLLNLVTRIADRVLPEGVIVYMQERDGKRTDFYSDEDYYDVPLAVLVNGMSASASEILAASVQALDRGTVVGLTTYGKGVVQTMTTYAEDGAGLQFTSACYYDANGRTVNGVGVTPDVEVALEADRVPVVPDPLSDNQLAAAIAEVRKK
ncbi:MAG: S41 family peptidase [Clostridia bacterium]|nr:S41 family peptidase [Clostridia bacterium]